MYEERLQRAGLGYIRNSQRSTKQYKSLVEPERETQTVVEPKETTPNPNIKPQKPNVPINRKALKINLN